VLNCSADGNVTRAAQAESKITLSKERLRQRHRPRRVIILFVGEAPPASGRFFYQADSGLYRAIREAFVEVFPVLRERPFLASFRKMGCFLVDLCRSPVDRWNPGRREKARRDGETRLSNTLKQLRPEIVVTVVRSIADNVERSQGKARWSGLHIKLPYPGRWHHHRIVFVRALAALLRKNCSRNITRNGVGHRELPSGHHATGKVKPTP